MWQTKLKKRTLDRRLGQWTEGREAVRLQATWDRWRVMVAKKAQQRYRADLAQRERLFIRERDGSLLRDTLSVSRWRLHYTYEEPD